MHILQSQCSVGRCRSPRSSDSGTRQIIVFRELLCLSNQMVQQPASRSLAFETAFFSSTRAFRESTRRVQRSSGTGVRVGRVRVEVSELAPLEAGFQTGVRSASNRHLKTSYSQSTCIGDETYSLDLFLWTRRFWESSHLVCSSRHPREILVKSLFRRSLVQ